MKKVVALAFIITILLVGSISVLADPHSVPIIPPMTITTTK